MRSTVRDARLRGALPSASRSPRRELTLIEVVIATALFALTMLGIAASFDSVRMAQVTARERQAAMTAAMSQMQLLITKAGADFADLSNDGTVPFHVVVTASSVELRPQSATAPGGALKPAPAGVWPAGFDRGGDTVHAGFYRVAAGADTPGRVEIDVVVAWRSAVGDGADIVQLRQAVANPRL